MAAPEVADGAVRELFGEGLGEGEWVTEATREELTDGRGGDGEQ